MSVSRPEVQESSEKGWPLSSSNMCSPVQSSPVRAEMMDSSDRRVEVRQARLRPSLFPNVPPYHVFLPYWRSYSEPPCPALKEEEWQFPAQIMPVVRDVVEHAGFKVKKVRQSLTRRGQPVGLKNINFTLIAGKPYDSMTSCNSSS